ncbi:MAG: hypothetical protein IKJ45_00235 [Kiritimatiellae bacterium]|nr:hypothetical protein [Kiritimatiellia bacterium]
MDEYKDCVMKEIGGYLELECGRAEPYHKDGVYLNSGRNALKYIIRCLGIKRIHVPHYTCPVVQQSISMEGCEVEMYELDSKLMPARKFPKNDFIIFNNYFGCTGQNVAVMIAEYPNLIVDNAQAFYSRQIGRAAFYSPRKFFGVPDGGVAVFRDKDDDKKLCLEHDVSFNRMTHLLKRIDLSAEAGYADFKAVSQDLVNAPVRYMSRLTKSLMGNIDYAMAAKARMTNFIYISEALASSFPFGMSADDVPMIYPYITGSDIRRQLFAKIIYVATYWSHVDDHGNMSERLLPLPIDQRYGEYEMDQIIRAVKI